MAQAQSRPEMLLLPVETNSSQRELLWSTDPGIRYELQSSTNLVTWTTVAGFPSKAEALAQQQMIELQAASKRFFRVLVLDEQPPEITSRIPADGSFGVRRFSSIAITLADATGINPASINLTVGARGTFSTGSSQVTFNGSTLTVSLGGDTALGGYGETVQTTLTVADTLGNTTNYVWSFELEKAVEAATNLFVFGSPGAQRAGQQLSGEAAVLAARYSAGPVRMGSSSTDWTIDSVTTNTIVLAYTSPSAPVFTAGQLLANLAPARISEIFYRRIDSLSDDSGAKKLTLYTTEVTLADVMVNGTFTLGSDAVFLDFDANGNLIRALSGDATFSLPDIGADFSGQTIFSDSVLNLSLQEGKFLFHPKLKVSVETAWTTVLRFDAQASGDIEISCVPLLTVSGAYTKNVEKEVWSKTKWIGSGYVYVELKATVTAKAAMSAAAAAEMKAGFRQNANMGVSGKYVRDAVPAATWERWFTVEPFQQVPFTYTVSGNGSATVSLVPQIDARVYGLGGLYVNADSRLELSGSATLVNGNLTQADWLLGAYADVYAGLSVIDFDSGSLPSLPPFRLFTAEWGNHYETAPSPAAPPVITRQPLSQNAKTGDPVAFSVEATAAGSLSYQWYQNGKLIPGQTFRTLSYSSVQSGHQGNYQVRVSASGLAVSSSIATLSIVTSGGTGSAPSGMVRIPGGSNSGSNPLGTGESYDGTYYPATYSLTVSAFYMDRTEVTKAQWDTVYNWAVSHGYSFANAGSGKAANHPVQTVSWYDCVKWCNARSQMEGRTPCYNLSDWSCNFSANGYRLPTNTEWEYAARGGLSGKRFPWGDTITHNQANYNSYSGDTYDISPTGGHHPSYATGSYPYTSPVGSFSANGYGLYDMVGNVWEWCNDASGSGRDVRGGSWFSLAYSARCGNAYWGNPVNACSYLGFRTVYR